MYLVVVTCDGMTMEQPVGLWDFYGNTTIQNRCYLKYDNCLFFLSILQYIDTFLYPDIFPPDITFLIIVQELKSLLV